MVVGTKENVGDQLDYQSEIIKFHYHVPKVGWYLKSRRKEALKKGKKE